MRHALLDLCRALVVILYKQNQLHTLPGKPASDARTLGTRLAPYSACILSYESPSTCGMAKQEARTFELIHGQGNLHGGVGIPAGIALGECADGDLVAAGRRTS